MIRKLVKYTDFNDMEQVEAFYFHISKAELLDNLALRVRLTALSASINGESRDLTDEEVEVMIELIRDLIKLSYGIRSEDGKRFHKSEEEYLAFKESAAYDAMLFGLFENPASAEEFVKGIIPKDLLDKTNQESAEAKREIAQPQDFRKKEETKSPAATVKPDQVPFEGDIVEGKPEKTETKEEEIARLKAQLESMKS